MSTRLRVMTYNIHKGFNTLNNRFLLREIRHSIRKIDSDLVFLQEVSGENSRYQGRVSNYISDAQFEFLADSVWDHQAYGKNALYDHGHHGNAILSKQRFLSWKNLDLTQIPTSYRGMLIGKIDPGIHVFCVHLGLLSWERQKQTEMVIKAIKQHTRRGEPYVLAGDFNDWRLRTHKRLVEALGVTEAHQQLHGRFAKTYPVWAPLLKMDRIYFKNMEVKEAQCLTEQPWNLLSDHCAIYAELSI